MIATTPKRDQLRTQMPITQRFSYLDHAAVSPLPLQAGKAIEQFAAQSTHEGDTVWLQWSNLANRTRQLAAELIASDESEIALVPNTTLGICVVAEGFPWQPGDNVVVPDNEFPSNLLPWRNLARRGVEIRIVPVGRQGQLTAEMLQPYVDSHTRIVSVSWVGFVTGFRCDLMAISQLVHAKGALLFVDAIQGLGGFPIDVHNLEIDFLAADGHKWLLGPEGAGILYVNKRHLEKLATIGVGWSSLAAAGFDPRSVQLKPSAARFEGGSMNMVGMMALGESLKLLLNLGAHQPNSGFQTAILDNVLELSNLLTDKGFLTTLPERVENRSGILGIHWANADSEGESAYLRARKHLLDRGVVVSVRAGRLRAATHAYNNSADHCRLVESLLEFRSQE